MRQAPAQPRQERGVMRPFYNAVPTENSRTQNGARHSIKDTHRHKAKLSPCEVSWTIRGGNFNSCLSSRAKRSGVEGSRELPSRPEWFPVPEIPRLRSASLGMTGRGCSFPDELSETQRALGTSPTLSPTPPRESRKVSRRESRKGSCQTYRPEPGSPRAATAPHANHRPAARAHEYLPAGHRHAVPHR